MLYNLTLEKPYEHLLHVWEDFCAEAGLVEDLPIMVRLAIPEDALLIDIREEQKDCFGGVDLDYLIRMYATLRMLTPMNYTVFHGDKLLLMANVIPVLKSVAEISFLVDKNFVNSSKELKVAMIKIFNKCLYNLPFKRLQCKVRHDFAIGQRFVEKLGFEVEGVLKEYGPEDHDYLMYGLLR